MNEEIAALQSALATLRAEMDEVKGTLKRLGRVITFEKVDGRDRAHLECAALVIRQVTDPRYIAVHLGAIEEGGFVSIYYQGEPDLGIRPAISLHLEDNEPHMQLRGKDGKPRTDNMIMNDGGAAAVFSPGGAPAALMRAQAEGGSVAVLQPDGKTRAMLIHDENTSGRMGNGPRTELTFALPDGTHLLRMLADAGGASLNMGPPGQADTAVLVGREGMGSVSLRSPGEGTSICLVATEKGAQITAMDGHVPGAATEASLVATRGGSRLDLHRPNGETAVGLTAQEATSGLEFLDESGAAVVHLKHFPNHFSSFRLSGGTENESIKMMAGTDSALLEVVTPTDPGAKVALAVNKGKPVVMVCHENRPLVLLGESGGSGTVNAYGPTSAEAGIASLAGGRVSGSLCLAQPDGTTLLTLDSTDEGGRLAINNDLGFQRILMGVHQESAALLMNHTGQPGVQLAATDVGGLITAYDAEGNPVATLPDLDAVE